MPEDEIPNEPNADDLAAQMEESYQDDEGGWEDPDDESFYADGVDEPELYEPDDYQPQRYVTADDLDARLGHLAETLLSRLSMDSPGKQGPDPLDEAFGEDEYAREIAQRLAPVLREQIAGEMYQQIRPVAESTANASLYSGLSQEASEILWQAINDPQNPIDPLHVAGNPTALRALRGMAQFEAAQAARTVAPRSDRTYMPSRQIPYEQRGEHDDLMKAFGTMPGFDPYQLHG
ncbi:hypothetical protein EON79_02350 [bacterium]|nr:MAG: hypothetical protein EON79_02350 [bacterium]